MVKQIIIGMVGYPASGKSTFAKKLVEEFNFSHVNKDIMRDNFIENIKYFNGADYSHSNDLISSVNRVVRPTSNILIQELINEGQSVIIDGYGKFKKSRDFYKERFGSIPIVIIYVKESREKVLERLGKRKFSENWLNKSVEVFIDNFSVPQEEECDLLLALQSGNTDEEKEIIKKVKKFTN